ncbi:hypothetical protein [Novipirellula aureliae]|uniref:hypothetical protein n=1 Tax=Novipirellula aureliae TaxID=2527966 RepID=UPI0018CD0E82|nr:hypothetical protein [Novipirellula aureliae]
MICRSRSRGRQTRVWGVVDCSQVKFGSLITKTLPMAKGVQAIGCVQLETAN